MWSRNVFGSMSRENWIRIGPPRSASRSPSTRALKMPRGPGAGGRRGRERGDGGLGRQRGVDRGWAEDDEHLLARRPLPVARGLQDGLHVDVRQPCIRALEAADVPELAADLAVAQERRGFPPENED